MTTDRPSPLGADEQRALDQQFTLDSVPYLDAIFARRAAASRDAVNQFAVRRGIRYGATPAETLNIFPASTPNAPIQLFIHGGFWSSLSADDFSFLARGFTPYGAGLMVIDYPLIPMVRMADVVRACQRAIAWAFRHGAQYGLNANRIFISGNSAGGHLVAEMMSRSWLRAAALPPDAIQGGCAISGLYDLAPVAASFRNDLLRLTPDEVAQFSPLRRPIDVAAPMIVTVGGDETAEFLKQSADYAAACRAAGSRVDHLVAPAANHITILLDEFANPDAPLNIAVRRQMGLIP